MPGDGCNHLARAQFAFTIGFHIVLPAFTIGLASYLAVLEALWLRHRAAGLHRRVPVLAADLRRRLRAWASSPASSWRTSSAPTGRAFADKAGPIVGPLMGYEVLTALLSGGRLPRRHAVRPQRVGPRPAFRSPRCWSRSARLISAFWILAANSWMQTPQGYTLTPDGRFMPDDWWADHLQSVVSLPPRAHGARVLSVVSRSWSARSALGICCATRRTRRRG